ncbi:MAG TPA: peptidase domain-containing ABC transporter [Lysobacter sp.]
MRVILQNEVAECGYACLAMVLGHFGRATTIGELQAHRPLSANGLKAGDLFDVAQDFGLQVEAFTFGGEDVRQIRKGSIVHFGGAHFLVFESAHRGYVRVIDPAGGRQRVAMDVFLRHASGMLLQFSRTPALQPIRSRTPTSGAIRQVFTLNHGLGGKVARIVLAGIAAQLAVLAMPYLGSLVLDHVVAQDNAPLLNVVAITFACIFAAGAFSQYVQAYMQELLVREVELCSSESLFARLLANPFGFFEKRNIGDLFARFKSQSEINQYAVKTPVGMFTDVLVGSLAMLLMIVQSPRLALLALAIFAAYLLVSLALYPRMRDLHQEEVMRSAACDDSLIETIRGASLIKLSQAEQRRTAQFMQDVRAWAGASMKHRGLVNTRNTILKLVDYADSLIVIWFAAKLMLGGKVSAGTFYSFLIYKSLMSTHFSSCINALFAYFMLRVPAERVEDIHSSYESERFTPLDRTGKEPRTANFECIEMTDVSFSYGVSDRPVLEGVTLSIRKGDHIVIEGPSGSGKSTLFKLLAAAIMPTGGDMRLNGVSWKHLAVDEIRRHMAHMRQGDIILHGSIAQNVSMFEANPDEGRIAEVLAAVGLADDILQLPMRTQTRISDTIANISAGQRQRLLLARALYASREVLMLDEPTSNLDPVTVQRVTHYLRSLPLTLVVITHDRALASCFDKAYRMHDGVLVPREVSVAASGATDAAKEHVAPEPRPVPARSVLPPFAASWHHAPAAHWVASPVTGVETTVQVN